MSGNPQVRKALINAIRPHNNPIFWELCGLGGEPSDTNRALCIALATVKNSAGDAAKGVYILEIDYGDKSLIQAPKRKWHTPNGPYEIDKVFCTSEGVYHDPSQIRTPYACMAPIIGYLINPKELGTGIALHTGANENEIFRLATLSLEYNYKHYKFAMLRLRKSQCDNILRWKYHPCVSAPKEGTIADITPLEDAINMQAARIPVALTLEDREQLSEWFPPADDSDTVLLDDPTGDAPLSYINEYREARERQRNALRAGFVPMAAWQQIGAPLTTSPGDVPELVDDCDDSSIPVDTDEHPAMNIPELIDDDDGISLPMDMHTAGFPTYGMPPAANAVPGMPPTAGAVPAVDDHPRKVSNTVFIKPGPLPEVADGQRLYYVPECCMLLLQEVRRYDLADYMRQILNGC